MAEKKNQTQNQIVVKNYDIAQAKDMQAMANVLKSHIVKHKLYTKIRDKNYVEVEGWQFAGGMLGILPQIVEVKDLSTDKEIKWLAGVKLVNIKDGETVGRGYALCSNKEAKKKSFDEYAVLSMAETRAIGKAYRSTIGWVMKVAGYEATPTEEMDTKMATADTVESDNPDVIDAVEKIGRMRSIPAIEKVQENIANSSKYNDKEKKTIQKAIDEQKEKLEEKQ